MYTKSKSKGKGERVSPYARKRRRGLVPFLYSNEYRAWSDAVRRGDASAIARTAIAHSEAVQRRFGGYDGSRGYQNSFAITLEP